ncbi:MAG: tRNA epoxyqueuosine(34) reductase QueG [Pseudomonadales bacterium]|nr:tRNA epoxyqueuosine(34) reductase QueG [Pseudomonadales bacterium]MCP5216065.1 tRNA epoxyqueuosine(34) reductase QueG [Pseudomonadales bacterium]
MPAHTNNVSTMIELAANIKVWGAELGFQQVGITDVALQEHEARLNQWLANGYHGELGYMAHHGSKRSHPEELLPGTLRVISVRLDYLTTQARVSKHEQQAQNAQVSRYALGRDYHKLMRKRLAKLAEKIDAQAHQHGCRAFVDSAPVMERALAEKSGLGWIGKNTMLLNREAGSYFFLGEIFTNLALPLDEVEPKSHCGNCTACLDICPTQAFVAPYVLDARKCISYLTIELKGPIPEPLRPKVGNRIFGCDDCQTICPWNRFAQLSNEADFQPRHGLDSAQLIELFNWTEEEFLEKTAGSAIRRAGYEGWLRNIAVALGNAPPDARILNALSAKQSHSSELVREHVNWALAQHTNKHHIKPE